MLDFFGKSFNFLAIYMNISGWLLSVHFNRLLVLVISLLAIIWWAMKIYQTYIETKRFKLKNRKDNEPRN